MSQFPRLGLTLAATRQLVCQGEADLPFAIRVDPQLIHLLLERLIGDRSVRISLRSTNLALQNRALLLVGFRTTDRRVVARLDDNGGLTSPVAPNRAAMDHRQAKQEDGEGDQI